MRTGRSLLPWLLFMIFCFNAVAQEKDLKKYPGYINLEEIKIPEKAGEVTEVTLGPALLKIAAMADDNEDEDLDEVLAGLHGIQVKSFEITSDEATTILPIMDRIEAKLNREGWERLVQVKGEDERVVVSIKLDEEKVAGLFVMSLEPGVEAAFVNVIGEINLNTLENLDIDLDDSTLDSLKKSLEKK
ncbi:MAG: DUF4252 domain-containing protein [Candidatus Glassbacteria bacterium]